jgi:glucosamine-6-phosphate deaminase
MTARRPVELTPVEKRALERSPFEILYEPEEKIPALVVDNFPALGKLAAMRFLELAQANPGGVVSLPTGKTPEHFISWVGCLLSSWERKETQAILADAGVDPSRRPDVKSLRFVQIDKFYPIDPVQHNSFHHYVNRYCIDGFGLDRDRCLLMDCTRIGPAAGQTLGSLWPDGHVDLGLRVRPPSGALEESQRAALARVDNWCQEYEEKIRALGGIGFFLGGLGPDGHVGFNVHGSDHHSTTQLAETNYETQAAAAGDLGGIGVSRHRRVITLGLGTITFNPACAALIIAAGEAKAAVVADAVQGEKSVGIPASALRVLPHASFCLTAGAAKLLRARQGRVLAQAARLPDERAEGIVLDVAMRNRKRLLDLATEDLKGDPLGEALLGRLGGPIEPLLRRVHEGLERKIEAGSRTADDVRFLHTEPHHDDIILGYLPAVVRHIRSAANTHLFATLTSGFTAVTNDYLRRRLDRMLGFLGTPEFEALHREGYFAPSDARGRDRDMWQFLDGLAAGSAEVRDEGASRRQARDLAEVYGDADLGAIRHRAEDLLEYLRTAYPGQKDPEPVQRLKGMCREWEAECLWGYFGWNTRSVMPLRLGFYTGDLFAAEPTLERDVAPLVDLLRRADPDVVTVALDPEGSGPDTHYKVLQAMTEALRLHAGSSGRRDIRVWGYRNVWYHFHPSEANVIVPVSLNMFAVMESAFMNTFVSQRDASFPSPDYDGPFCGLAQRIQSRQYQAVKTCLGRQWFHEHPAAIVRAARGLVFLREMRLEELAERCRELRKAAENA